jgi:hypothetical protein
LIASYTLLFILYNTISTLRRKRLQDIINCVGDYLCDGLDVLEKALKTEVNTTDGSAVAAGVDRIYALLDAAISKNFDIFELYVLKNLVHVPDNLVLPEEQAAAKAAAAAVPTYTEAEEAAMDKELKELRTKVKAATYMKAALSTENSQMDVEFAAYDALLPPGGGGDAVVTPFGKRKALEPLAVSWRLHTCVHVCVLYDAVVTPFGKRKALEPLTVRWRLRAHVFVCTRECLSRRLHNILTSLPTNLHLHCSHSHRTYTHTHTHTPYQTHTHCSARCLCWLLAVRSWRRRRRRWRRRRTGC